MVSKQTVRSVEQARARAKKDADWCRNMAYGVRERDLRIAISSAISAYEDIGKALQVLQGELE